MCLHDIRINEVFFAQDFCLFVLQTGFPWGALTFNTLLARQPAWGHSSCLPRKGVKKSLCPLVGS